MTFSGAWDRTSVLSVYRRSPESPRICRAVRHRESDHSEYTDSPSGQTRPILQSFPVLTSNLSLHPSLRLSHTHLTCPFLYPETCRQRKQIHEWLVLSNTYIIFQNRHLTRVELLIISANRNIPRLPLCCQGSKHDAHRSPETRIHRWQARRSECQLRAHRPCTSSEYRL